MAISLANAKKLSQDKLTDQIIDEFRTSPLLDALQFDNTVKAQGGRSLSYVYNRITTQPTAAGRAINNEYSPQEAATTQYTVNLAPIGGSYQIDRVIAEDEVQLVDHVEFQSTQKAKAAVALFNDLFINGDVSGNSDPYDGIEKAVTGATTVLSGSDLSTAANIKANYATFLHGLRQLVGKLDGAPTHLLMNNDMYAVFQSVSDHVPNITFTRNELGDEVGRYGSAILVNMGDKPGTTNPIIPTESDGTTDIYAVRLGLDGVHAVSPEGSKVVRNYLPDFSTPGAVKTGEVELVTAVAVKAVKSVGKLTSVIVTAGSADSSS